MLGCGRADWRFRFKQGFGGLARSSDPLAIIAARVRLLLSAKQDICSEWLISFAIIEETFREFGKLDLGSRRAIRKRALMAQPRSPECLSPIEKSKFLPDRNDTKRL
ncbi:MAG: hypothetical protein WB611_14240 [Stellaceae bacterium]